MLLCSMIRVGSPIVERVMPVIDLLISPRDIQGLVIGYGYAAIGEI
jgi:hypothetical protein